LKDGSVLLRAGLEGAPPRIHEADHAPLDPESADGGANLSGLSPFDARYREGLVARLRGGDPVRGDEARPFDRAALLAILRAHRTPELMAQSLAEQAEKSGLADMTLALASALDKYLQADPIHATQRDPILLIGPPGAGKTAVAARLAAQSCLTGFPVRLAATDLESAGQAARLEGFAACLNVPMVQAPRPEVLAGAIDEARAAGALLIADSGGCDPRAALPRELLAFLSMGRLEIVGVVSAANDAEEAADIAVTLTKLGARRLIVTGLDLVQRKGALVALALSGAGIAQTTASPYLADGFDTLTPLSLARALLADSHAGQRQMVA
jgi:flagellar biosynthesis protein FlhF